MVAMRRPSSTPRCGTACAPRWSRATATPTLELKVNYARALTVKSGLVTCEGRVVNRGSRIAISEARLTGDGGKTLYAYGSSTLMIVKL